MRSPSTQKGRDGSDQEQFLTILSREDAMARFEAALFRASSLSRNAPWRRHLGLRWRATSWPTSTCRRSTVPMSTALRSFPPISPRRPNHRRFAFCSTTSHCLRHRADEARGLSGTATSIATGGPLPRGADAIVMVEHTQPQGNRRDRSPPRGFARPVRVRCAFGSDIARGETVLRAGTVIGSREIGMCAAVGSSEATVVRRPRAWR